MKFQVIHWMGQQPPLPGAVKLDEGNEERSPTWEIEVRDLDHLMELSQHGSLAIIHPALHPTRKERAAGKPEFGEPYLAVDFPGKRFNQR